MPESKVKDFWIVFLAYAKSLLELFGYNFFIQGSELLPLVSQLQDLIKAQTKAKTMTEEGSMNSHAAFISLKLLCRHIGQQHTESFVKVGVVLFQFLKFASL